MAAVELEGFVYLFGGETFSPRSTFVEAERYDPQTDSWARLPPMPTARHGLGAAVLDGRIHVVSGGPEAGLAFSNIHEVLTPVLSASARRTARTFNQGQRSNDVYADASDPGRCAGERVECLNGPSPSRCDFGKLWNRNDAAIPNWSARESASACR